MLRWLLLGLWWGLTSSCLAQSAASPRLVTADETITVGLLGNFPPFHQWPEEAPSPKGLDVELLAELARTTGLRFEYRRYRDFASLDEDLRRGRVMLTPAMAQTAERALTLRFTRPYASVQQAFVGPSTLTSVPSTPDLSGRRLALAKGHVAETIAIERFPAAARPTYGTVDDAVDAVVRGDADFVLEALPTLQSLMAARPHAGLAVLRTYGFPEGHLRLAAALPQAALIRQLDSTIAALPPEWLKQLREKWIQAPATPAMSTMRPGVDLKPLRVGYLAGDRPFSLRRDDGQAEGIGIEMMKAVARRAGLEIEAFVAMDLATALKDLGEGRLDVMLGLTDIAERRPRMTFVGPYRANPVVIISRKQYSIWDLHQLSGQRLAMIGGFFGAPYIKADHPTIQIVDCVRFEECLDQVETGRADAALYGLQGAYARLGPRAGTTLQITGTVPGLYDEHNLGISLARASLAPRLREALNIVLLEEMPAIERNWAQSELQQPIDWARIRWAASLALAAMLGLLAAWWWHSQSLRREIARTQSARDESDQYLAFMAHEVRNSLQSVSGAVALLRGSSQPDARQQPLLEALGLSARSTLALLNGLLDRHRLQQGRLALELRADSLERALRAVVDEMMPAAQAKGLMLTFERRTPLDGWWHIDALRVQQILRNLLINAVKFSVEGTITLRAGLELSEQGEDWRRVCIDVIDQGPGMDDAGRAKLFERFASSGGDRPGTGLGLNLCRDLATALGGTLDLTSSPGVGSTFILRFDAQAAKAPDMVARGHVARLLVVEDSPVYSLLLRQAFENQGVTTVVADSLAQAREALVASVAGAGVTAPAFDLVLADTNLGDGTADELLRFMREAVRPGVRMPPVICMSAEFDDSTLRRLEQAGATGALTKDSDIAAFAARVLTNHQQHAQSNGT